MGRGKQVAHTKGVLTLPLNEVQTTESYTTAMFKTVFHILEADLITTNFYCFRRDDVYLGLKDN